MNEQEFIEVCKCGETTTVQFKQEFTGQREIAKEMIAFANTRGGKILFGVKDKTGDLVGLTYDEIQNISRELGNIVFCEKGLHNNFTKDFTKE